LNHFAISTEGLTALLCKIKRAAAPMNIKTARVTMMRKRGGLASIKKAPFKPRQFGSFKCICKEKIPLSKDMNFF